MWRAVEVIAIAVGAQIIAGWLQGLVPTVSTLTDASELDGIAVAMTATAIVAALVTWRALWPSPVGGLAGFGLMIVGGLTAYGWPISSHLALPTIDIVSGAWQRAALPAWEGTMIVVLGGALVLRAAGRVVRSW